jgi:hypothetical protein
MDSNGRCVSHGSLSWRFALFFAVLFLLAPNLCWCQIYMGAGVSDGSIVLSNFKSEIASIVVVSEPSQSRDPGSSEIDKIPSAGGAKRIQPSVETRRLVDKVAKQTDVSAELLRAVIAAESNWDPKAVSRKGAIGLMQLMPATGKRFGAQDLYSSEQNVVAGASYLKWLMSQFGENLELVLAAYNAGEQAVIKAGHKVPPFPETEAYVRGILDGLRKASAASV